MSNTSLRIPRCGTNCPPRRSSRTCSTRRTLSIEQAAVESTPHLPRQQNAFPSGTVKCWNRIESRIVDGVLSYTISLHEYALVLLVTIPGGIQSILRIYDWVSKIFQHICLSLYLSWYFASEKSVQSIWFKFEWNSRFLMKHDIIACTNKHNLYVRIGRIPRQYPFALIRDKIWRKWITRWFSDRTTTSKWMNKIRFFLRETIRWFRSTSTGHTCSILGLGKESKSYGA